MEYALSSIFSSAIDDDLSKVYVHRHIHTIY